MTKPTASLSPGSLASKIIRKAAEQGTAAPQLAGPESQQEQEQGQQGQGQRSTPGPSAPPSVTGGSTTPRQQDSILSTVVGYDSCFIVPIHSSPCMGSTITCELLTWTPPCLLLPHPPAYASFVLGPCSVPPPALQRGVLAVARDIAAGMAYLHSLNVCHG